MRYAEPAEDHTAREGNLGLLVLLALGLAIAAVSLAMLSHDDAEPFVLAILAGLAVIGVFSLFAGAVGILRFGERSTRNDATKAFVDNLANGALITNPDGTTLYANEAYRRLLGLAAHDRVPNIERAFSGNPEIAENIFRLSRAARQGRLWTEEFAISAGDPASGEPARARLLRVSVRQIPDTAEPGRQEALTVWQLQDITGEQQSEDNAFEKLQRVIEHVDGAPAGFFSADAEGRIDYLNATLATWLGLELSDVAAGGLGLGDIFSSDAAALLTPGEDSTVSSEARTFDFDLKCRDGSDLPARVLHRVVPGHSGRGRAHILVLKRPEEGAAGEGSVVPDLHVAHFFQTAPIAIATVDAEGCLSSTNAAFARMFPEASEKGPERRIAITGLVGDSGREALEKALQDAKAGKADFEPVDAPFGQDDARNGRFYVSPIEPDEVADEVAIVYAIDTTEQRALEFQIAQSQKMQAIGQLAGGIAHDFNNVLTVIIGVSDLLLANHRPNDPAFQDIMSIKQNANRAAGLVRQLLAFSRQQTLRPQRLWLGDVLTDLTILLGRLLGEDITLKVVHGRELWPVKADLHQFEQVIINLAVNARDAMPEGGTLTVTTGNVSERAAKMLGYPGMQPAEFVLCEVTDTGCGMDADVLDKIFEPFFSTKEVGKGTGLGLSTVYGIVKQTGGYIFAESEPGEGTTFRIYLPRDVSEDAEAEASPPQSAPKKKPVKDLTGTGTVLLVEDEEAVRSFAARALTTRGYEVLQASTGAEALELIDEHGGRVDLVVSDVVMPEMDGPTLLRHLRERYRDLKIIFISGYAEDAFRKNLEEKEQFAFLPKPFSLKQLAEAVKETLEG